MQYKTHILEFSDDYQSLQFPEINEDHNHEVSKVCMQHIIVSRVWRTYIWPSE